MSSASESDLAALQRRVLEVYGIVTVLMLVGITVLIYYVVSLGSLSAPGNERSFGFAIALMSLMAAAIFHVIDRSYRVWPLGRRFRPSPRPLLSTLSWVTLLKVILLAATVAALAYLLAGVLT